MGEPPRDEEPWSLSEFVRYDEEILNESLGGPRYDEAHLRLLRLACKVTTDNNWFPGRIQDPEYH